MQVNIKKVKILVMVPKEYLDLVRAAACNAGAGIIGNYTCCSNCVQMLGSFKPSENATPFIGENGKLEFVEEWQLGVICEVKIAKKVIAEIRKVHPYEEPGIDIIPLMDESEL